jgi:hypothetical protein
VGFDQCPTGDFWRSRYHAYCSQLSGIGDHPFHIGWPQTPARQQARDLVKEKKTAIPMYI